MLDAKLALAFVLGAVLGASSERCGSEERDTASPSATGSLKRSEVEPPPLPPLPPPPNLHDGFPKQIIGEACDACLSAASSGNIVGAASAAGKCTDATKKAQCTSKVKKAAPGVAKTAAFNNQCGAAKAIVAAAEGMGAGSSSLKKSVATCK